jgi:hypothetical protein
MELEIYEYLIGNYTDGLDCDTHISFNNKKPLKKLTSKINKTTNSIYLFQGDKVNNKDSNNNVVCSNDPIGNIQIGGWDYDKYLDHYNSISPKRTVDAVYERIRNIYDFNGNGNTKFINILKDARNVNQKIFNYLKDNNYEEKGFIYKLEVKPSQKVIIFGDFHGSFHGFLRHIQRFIALGIITLKNNNFIINPNYIILFCGDIFDRGLSAELFIMILNLIIHNQGNIIFNRGNHETFKIFSEKDTRNNLKENVFLGELVKKMKVNKDEYNQLVTCLKNFVTSCPTAVSVEYDSNNKIWCCHGGVPILDCFDDDRIKEELSETIIKLFNNEKVCDIQSLLRNNKIVELNKPLATQIRWNDLNLNIDDSKELSLKDGGRGAGLNVSKKSLDKFLSLNGYKFLVRGHQDSVSNTVLFGETSIMKGGNNNHNHNHKGGKNNYKGGSDGSFIQSKKSKIGECIQKIIKNKYLINLSKPILSKLESKIELFKLSSPIGRIELNDKNKVILNIKDQKELIFEGNATTISNNSDCGRSLTKDSFLLLSKIGNQRIADKVFESKIDIEPDLWTTENIESLDIPIIIELLKILTNKNKSVNSMNKTGGSIKKKTGGSIKKKKSKKKKKKI